MLIEGASGAGKSDLALRLIDRGATLVSDDYTLLTRADGGLIASAPATIAGQIEIRGLGVIPLPHADKVRVALVVRLTESPERMPLDEEVRRIAGVGVRSVAIDPRSASAAIKVELALNHLCGAEA